VREPTGLRRLPDHPQELRPCPLRGGADLEDVKPELLSR
jgi:hypothetical protein